MNFHRAIFTNNSLLGSSLIEANLRGVEIENSDFKETNLAKALFMVSWCNKTDFSNANLERIKAIGSTFSNSVLNNTKLISADLRNTTFDLCSCIGADFQGSDMSTSKLKNTSFRNANFRSCNLKDSTIELCDFEGAIYNNETILPSDNFDIIALGAKKII